MSQLLVFILNSSYKINSFHGPSSQIKSDLNKKDNPNNKIVKNDNRLESLTSTAILRHSLKSSTGKGTFPWLTFEGKKNLTRSSQNFLFQREGTNIFIENTCYNSTKPYIMYKYSFLKNRIYSRQLSASIS